MCLAFIFISGWMMPCKMWGGGWHIFDASWSPRQAQKQVERVSIIIIIIIIIIIMYLSLLSFCKCQLIYHLWLKIKVKVCSQVAVNKVVYWIDFAQNLEVHASHVGTMRRNLKTFMIFFGTNRNHVKYPKWSDALQIL